jgi:hypothetical protein
LTLHHTGLLKEEDYSIKTATAAVIQKLVSAAKTDELLELLQNLDDINAHSS